MLNVISITQNSLSMQCVCVCKCTKEHIYWYRETMHAIEQCLAFAQLSFFLRTMVATISCTGLHWEKLIRKQNNILLLYILKGIKVVTAVYTNNFTPIFRLNLILFILFCFKTKGAKRGFRTYLDKVLLFAAL